VKAASAAGTIRHIYRSAALFRVIANALLGWYPLRRGTFFSIKFGKIKFLEQLSCLGSANLLLIFHTLFLQFLWLLFRLLVLGRKRDGLLLRVIRGGLDCQNLPRKAFDVII